MKNHHQIEIKEPVKSLVDLMMEALTSRDREKRVQIAEAIKAMGQEVLK